MRRDPSPQPQRSGGPLFRSSCQHKKSLFWHQLYLLTVKKNLIMMRRNKLWTLFEFLMPLVILGFTAYGMSRISAESKVSQNFSFTSIPVTGSYKDIVEKIAPMTRPTYERWGSRPAMKIAYTCNERNRRLAKELMANVTERYRNTASTRKAPSFELEPVYFPSESEMEDGLRSDVVESNEMFTSPVLVKRFVGGVIFTELDVQTSRLAYTLRFPDGETSTGRCWRLGKTWLGNTPFGAMDDIESRSPILGNPPYWTDGFLTLQMAIDDTFVEMANEGVSGGSTIALLRIPEHDTNANTELQGVTKALPIVFAFAAFPLFLHTIREIVTERESGMKDYLSVMGMGPNVFYASHIVVAVLKAAIMFSIAVIVMAPSMPFIRWYVFAIIILCYAISIVFLATAVSMFFTSGVRATQIAAVIFIALATSIKSAPEPEDLFNSICWSVNPIIAFYYAMTHATHYIHFETALGIRELAEGFTDSLTTAWALIMLILDTAIAWCIVIFVEVLTRGSTIDHLRLLWGAISGRKQESRQVREDIALRGTCNEEMLREDDCDIVVRGMGKTWGNGTVAIHDVSFMVPRGQITVMLGYNGAGKSSTFSVLTGQTLPSAGRVELCGHDVVHQRREAQQHIGYCPQGNSLFPTLNVDEHLALFQRLKGAKSNPGEITNILRRVNLIDKRRTLAGNLSGGQKRKLCVAMALIGGSDVIMLDEPTAGMDTGARCDVEELLLSLKKDKTIVITTHYMDEAERLCDRLLIIANGGVAVDGTLPAIRKKFGTGYILTVVLSDGMTVDDVKDALLKECKRCLRTTDVILSGTHGKQLEFLLPAELVHSFSTLFESLERNPYVSSMGVSVNSLDQVFIRVHESIEKDGGMTEINRAKEALNAFMKRDVVCLKGPRKLIQQFTSLLWKRLRFAQRVPSHLIFQLVFPSLFLLLFTMATRIPIATNEELFRSYDVKSMPDNTVFSSRVEDSPLADIANRYVALAQLSKPLFNPLLLPGDGSNVTEFFLKRPRVPPANGIGILSRETDTVLLFNGRLLHSPPTALSLWNNARLDARTGYIRTSFSQYVGKNAVTRTLNELVGNSTIALLLGPILLILFAFITSGFALFLVQERVSRFGHQQLLTGVSPLIFWGVTVLWDLAIFSIGSTIFTLVIIANGWMDGFILPMLLIFILYFYSCTPFVYAISLLFKTASKATAVIQLLQVALPIAYAVFTVFMAALIFGGASVDSISLCGYFLLPPYGFSSAMLKLVQYAAAVHGEETDVSILDWEFGIGQQATAMFLYGSVSILLLLLFSLTAVQQFWYSTIVEGIYKILGRHQRVHVGSWDEDVKEERIRVVQNRSSMLHVKELHKFYGRFHAVRGVSFNVNANECFGLLGVNGAGKTTTFDVITGVQMRSEGDVLVNKVDVIDNPSLGYCPQQDAILLSLSGMECLVLIASLRGLRRPEEWAQSVLDVMSLSTETANKPVQFYSGGQRRRLSLGISLLGRPDLLVLDEPTTGIDPRARRQIWELLKTLRDEHGQSILLTSHSMDECDALCTRIGVLHQGELVAIGQPQHLKSRFGTVYTVSLSVPEGYCRVACSMVTSRWDQAKMMENINEETAISTGQLKWQVPRENAGPWSKFFRTGCEVARQLGEKIDEDTVLRPAPVRPATSTTELTEDDGNVRTSADKSTSRIDFTLAQPSLEHVFQLLANGPNTSDPTINNNDDDDDDIELQPWCSCMLFVGCKCFSQRTRSRRGTRAEHHQEYEMVEGRLLNIGLLNRSAVPPRTG